MSAPYASDQPATTYPTHAGDPLGRCVDGRALLSGRD
jgi:hypothetical protein